MTVKFVGSGPGAADLLTVRAARHVAEADLVLYPGSYLDPDVLTLCSEDAKVVDTQKMVLDEIIEMIAKAHADGDSVVRLTSGDPSLYSALFEQTRRLDEAGVPWDVTPGVPAYAAAAAMIGRELTVPLVAQSVVLTRTQAESTAMPDTESLSAFAATRATLVLHLAITKVRELMTEIEPEYGADCPAVVVYRASQLEQQVLTGTVATIADQVAAAKLRQAAVIMVGQALAGPEAAGGESHLYDAGRDRSHL